MEYTFNHFHDFLRDNAQNFKNHEQNKNPCFFFKMWIKGGTQQTFCKSNLKSLNQVSNTMWLTIKTIKIQLLQLKYSNWLITLFYCSKLIFVTNECSKTTTLFSSVMPYARSLTKFVKSIKIYKNSRMFAKF